MHATDKIGGEDEESFEDGDDEKIMKLLRRNLLCEFEVAVRDCLRGKKHLDVSASDNRHRSSSCRGRERSDRRLTPAAPP